jgi:hypothetical protein
LLNREAATPTDVLFLCHLDHLLFVKAIKQ